MEQSNLPQLKPIQHIPQRCSALRSGGVPEVFWHHPASRWETRQQVAAALVTPTLIRHLSGSLIASFERTCSSTRVMMMVSSDTTHVQPGWQWKLPVASSRDSLCQSALAPNNFETSIYSVSRSLTATSVMQTQMQELHTPPDPGLVQPVQALDHLEQHNGRPRGAFAGTRGLHKRRMRPRSRRQALQKPLNWQPPPWDSAFRLPARNLTGAHWRCMPPPVPQSEVWPNVVAQAPGMAYTGPPGSRSQKRKFKGNAWRRRRSTPRFPPPAPHNDNSFLLNERRLGQFLLPRASY